jgi:hypothetical protein
MNAPVIVKVAPPEIVKSVRVPIALAPIVIVNS